MNSRTDRLPVETRLLLSLVAGRHGAGADEDARQLLAGPISWDQFLEQSRFHGLAPLAYKNLQALGFPQVPPEIEASLQLSYRTNTVRNLMMSRELRDVTAALETAGIPVIPWKGVGLAFWLYGDISLRVCGDIDVIVPRQLVREAFAVLTDLGYRAVSPPPTPALVARRKECSMARTVGGAYFGLDLHWDIVEGSPQATEDMWAQSRPDPRFGSGLAMSPEWQLLSVGVHACLSAWYQLKWVVDVHDCCLVGEIDWDELQRTAQRLGWANVLATSLGVSTSLLGTPLPVPAMARRPPRWVPLPFGATFPMWHVTSMRLRLISSPLAKARYLGEMLVVKPDGGTSWRSISPLRPARFARKWGRTILRRPSG